MKIVSIIALCASFTIPGMARAQHGGSGGSPPVHTPPREASQLDLLIGQWELLVRPQAAGLAQRIHGVPRITGTWKAWRAFDGFGVEDELRMVDGSGNPVSLAHTLRFYDAGARAWKFVTLDVYRGRVTEATARWETGQVQASGRGTDAEGRAYETRTRFYDITADGFRWQQDRSLDGGRTWDEAVLRIEARRVAATAPR